MPYQLILDAVFGGDSTGNTPEERAASSKVRFVRSLDQIAFDSESATGRKLSAAYALDAYASDPTASLCARCVAVAATMRRPRA